jgi:hypothetical protein
MGPKKILRICILIVATFLLLGAKVNLVSADTYNVNAVVPYEPPTHAAVITSPAEEKGSLVYDAQQIIKGTCQLQNPRAVVAIWKGQTILGSTECVDGSFSISVVLHLGENNLVARTANANGIYGPDSEKVKIQLKQPVNVTPLPSGVNQPTTVKNHAGAINQGGVSGLLLTSEAPFDLLPVSKKASIRVVVDGGQRPYILQLKWGDGSTESHSISEAGTYEFTHTYVAHKTYSVYVALKDVLGAYTEYVYAVVSGTKTATAASDATKAATTTVRSDPWRFVGIVWYYWIFIVFVIVFLLSSYVIGYRKGRERSEIEAEQKALTAKRKKRKSKKK